MLHGPPDEARTRRPGTLGNTPCQSDRVTHNSLFTRHCVSHCLYSRVYKESVKGKAVVSSRAREDKFPGPVSRARDIQRHAPYLRQRHLNGRGGRLDGPLSCASMPSPPVPRAAWCASARHPRDVVPHALVLQIRHPPEHEWRLVKGLGGDGRILLQHAVPPARRRLAERDDELAAALGVVVELPLALIRKHLRAQRAVHADLGIHRHLEARRLEVDPNSSTLCAGRHPQLQHHLLVPVLQPAAP
mmetsp:Transcript_35001/g.114294  ORF Transcript_35001/g.114294 Transcript_35001/m.114294 type:complete len:245 (-) Transcript_35001:114-848(-)